MAGKQTCEGKTQDQTARSCDSSLLHLSLTPSLLCAGAAVCPVRVWAAVPRAPRVLTQEGQAVARAHEDPPPEPQVLPGGGAATHPGAHMGPRGPQVGGNLGI